MNRRLLVVLGMVFGLSLAICGGAASVASAAPTSIINVPAQVVQTSDGTVGYRSYGSGRPLVLIMGFSGSDDAWTPTLVNALAKRHRVITFDLAGIGKTTMLPGTLTISAMADQTAAMITALHLNKPDVLGWSEGGMIAQALAVRHPRDVRRLVLCATFLGNGKATVSVAAGTALYNAAVAGNFPALLKQMFPPDQEVTQSAAYQTSVLQYLDFHLPPAAVDQAQIKAAQGWGNGNEKAGHGRITVPTLIGDGAEDAVIPPVNVAKIARAIKGAKSTIYPDAGHMFLFQDATAWAARVNRFLG